MSEKVKVTFYISKENRQKLQEICNTHLFLRTQSDVLNYLIKNYNMDAFEQSELETHLQPILSKLGYLDKQTQIAVRLLAGLLDHQEVYYFEDIHSELGSPSYRRAKKFVEEEIQKNKTKKISSEYRD